MEERILESTIVLAKFFLCTGWFNFKLYTFMFTFLSLPHSWIGKMPLKI